MYKCLTVMHFIRNSQIRCIAISLDKIEKTPAKCTAEASPRPTVIPINQTSRDTRPRVSAKKAITPPVTQAAKFKGQIHESSVFSGAYKMLPYFCF